MCKTLTSLNNNRGGTLDPFLESGRIEPSMPSIPRRIVPKYGCNKATLPLLPYLKIYTMCVLTKEMKSFEKEFEY